MSDVKRVAVIGAGTMGNGIAQVFASSGCEVLLSDVKQEFLDRGLKSIRDSLERLVKKEKLTAAGRDETLGRLRSSTRLEDAAPVDFAVEAVFEDLKVKREIFATLDRVLRPEVVLASNTSSISITAIAAATRRADRVIGIHFMNPVPIMKLVEVIRGHDTSDATCALVRGLCEKLGKTMVEANDYPGFVANRILMPMINEAIFALFEGVAKAEAIDEVMKLGMNHPMGPLTLADFIGLDVCLAILEVLQRELGDDKYRPCPLLRRMVAAGHLGKKTGRGFYTYAAN
ncbi:MAG: 3-hydroxybutyryl-CoA dehydrogenase [Planctomycetes bacterium]|nr:3-hydroxybutyryl-CoA dehydrogenase [Planctomycetota bacterium]